MDCGNNRRADFVDAAGAGPYHGCMIPDRLLLAFCVCVLTFLLLMAVSPAVPAEDKPPAATQPGEKQLAEAWAVMRQCLDPLTPEEKQNIEKLITDLASNRWKVRQSATEKLSRMDIRALPIISQAAKSEDPEVASRAKLALKAIQTKADNISNKLNPVIDILAAAQDKKLVPTLIELLNHANTKVCYVAEYALRRLTGKNFGYNCYSAPLKRAQAIEKWLQWWEKSRDDFDFAVKVEHKPFCLLICDSKGEKLTAVTPDGKVAWSRKLPNLATCAAGLPNGNVLVAYYKGPVVEYDTNFKEVWKFDKITDHVADILPLANGNILITLYPKNRMMEVNRDGKIVWEKAGFGFPYSARLLPNGNILVAGPSKNVVSEYSRNGKIAWKKTGLRQPYDALKLPSGNVLIAESGLMRIVEVNIAGKVVWQQKCSTRTSSVCLLPDGTMAVRLWSKGVVLMDRNGKTIRWLVKDRDLLGKVRLAPAAIMGTKQSATLPTGRQTSSQPSVKPKK